MTNRVYPAALTACLTGGLDWTAGDMRVAAFTAALYDPTHASLARLGEPIADAPLDGCSVTGDTAFADDATFASVTSGYTITTLIIYRATDGLLVAWIDKRGDTVPLRLETNGGNVVVTWPNRAVFKI